MMELNPNPSGASLFSNRWSRRLAQTRPIRRMALLAMAVLCCGAANAKTVYVNDAIVTPGNGNSWATAFKYLRDALAATTTNDEIWVAKGTYYPDNTLGIDTDLIYGDREVSFQIKGQKVYGGFVGTESLLTDRNPVLNPTILTGEIWPGQILYSSFHVASVLADSTLDGLTLQNGNANGSLSWILPRIPAYDSGGACYVTKDKVLTLQGCTFRNNRSVEFGGAIMIEGGDSSSSAGRVIATTCTFDQNLVNSTPLGPSSCKGGAIFGNVTATNCTFTANQITAAVGASGGAIFGDVNGTNCVFTGNTLTTSVVLLEANASGGAISGDVIGKNCTFTANTATSTVASGGAIRGSIVAANFVFSANFSTAGTIADLLDGTGAGGGGALYTEEGSSSLVNCVFVKNTSGIRGGAIVAGTSSTSSSLLVTDSTFLDNGVATTGSKGAALCCMGIVRIANNIFWHTVATSGAFNQSDMISVTKGGVLRNTYDNYPVSTEFARNVVKLRALAITTFRGADSYIGDPVDNLVAGDPLFFNAADPDGVDNLWRTADDGLRIKAGSSAIGTTSTIMNRGRLVPYRNFLLKDTLDIDGDGDVTELTPADIAAYSRVQNILVPLPQVLTPYLDMGAYEYGDLLNAPEISVEYPAATILVDGTSTIDFTALASVSTTFVIKNLGGSDLKTLSITGDGVNISDFKFSQPVIAVVPAGSSTTFTVTFAPSAVGVRNAAIHIVSNDANENPFDINLTGTALLPDIAVEYPAGTPLVDDSSTVDYGIVGLSGTSTRTFTIRNTGLGNLSILNISIAGAAASSYVATAPGSTFLTAGQFTTFDLTFTASAIGVQAATLIIESTDPDAEAFFSIDLTANVVGSPEISVRQPFSPELVDGDINDFGPVVIGSTYSKTFTVKNTGTATLKNIVISLTGSGTFSQTVFPVTKLLPGAQKDFIVTFKPAGAGDKTAALQIKSNDFDESQIDVTLIGSGISKFASRKRTAAAAASLVPTSPLQANATSPVADTIKSVSAPDGSKYLVLTVEKTAGWALSPHTVQVSSNLVDWFSGAKHTTILVDNGTTLKVRDNTPIVEGQKRYIRLK